MSPLSLDSLTFPSQMNVIAGEYGAGLAQAGRLFEQRLGQISSVVGLQEEQLGTIMDSANEMKRRSGQILVRYERATSRQQNLLGRLTECSHRIAGSLLPLAIAQH